MHVANPHKDIEAAIKYHSRNGVPDFRSLPAYYVFLREKNAVDKMLAMLLADKNKRILHGRLSGVWSRVQDFKKCGWTPDPKPLLSLNGYGIYDGRHRILWALAKNLPCPVELVDTRPVFG